VREAIEKVLRWILYGGYRQSPVKHTLLIKRVLGFLRDMLGGIYDDVGEE
jgi:hypothetical protein